MSIPSLTTQPTMQVGASYLGDVLKDGRLSGLQNLGNGPGPSAIPAPVGSGAGAIGEYQHAVHSSARARTLWVLEQMSQDVPYELGTALKRVHGDGAPFGTRVMNQLTVMGAIHHALQKREEVLQATTSADDTAALQEREAIIQSLCALEEAMGAVARRAAACRDGAADGFEHGCRESHRLVEAMKGADAALAACHKAVGSEALVESLVHGVIAPHLHDAVQARWSQKFEQNVERIRLDDVLHKDFTYAAGWASQNLLGSRDADEFKAGVFHLLKLPEYVLDGRFSPPGTDNPDGPRTPDGPGRDQGPTVPAGSAPQGGAPIAIARNGNVTGGDTRIVNDFSTLRDVLGQRQAPTADLRDLLSDVYNRARADGEEIGRLKAENAQLRSDRDQGLRLPDLPAAVRNRLGETREDAGRTQNPDATDGKESVSAGLMKRTRVPGPPVPPKPVRAVHADTVQALRAGPQPGGDTLQDEWRAYTGELAQTNINMQSNWDKHGRMAADEGDRLAQHLRGRDAGPAFDDNEVVLTGALPSYAAAYARARAQQMGTGHGLPAGITAQIAQARLAAGSRGLPPAPDPADTEWHDASQALQRDGLEAGSAGRDPYAVVSQTLQRRGGADVNSASPRAAVVQTPDVRLGDGRPAQRGTVPMVAMPVADPDFAEWRDTAAHLQQHGQHTGGANNRSNHTLDKMREHRGAAREAAGHSSGTLPVDASRRQASSLFTAREPEMVTLPGRNPLVSLIPPPPPMPPTDPDLRQSIVRGSRFASGENPAGTP